MELYTTRINCETGVIEEIVEEITLTEEEIAQQVELETQAKAAEVRTERNKMLADTDWFMLREKEHGTYLPADFKNFRDALRDIPLQEGFPANVVFPFCKPEWLPK